MLLTMALLAAVPQTQAQMTRSAGAAYVSADAAMTRAWKQAYAYMKGRDSRDTSRGGGFGYAAALLESQRTWLKFRDAECVIEGGEFAGGSMQTMTITACRTRLTTARTVQLKSLMWKR